VPVKVAREHPFSLSGSGGTETPGLQISQGKCTFTDEVLAATRLRRRRKHRNCREVQEVGHGSMWRDLLPQRRADVSHTSVVVWNTATRDQAPWATVDFGWPGPGGHPEDPDMELGGSRANCPRGTAHRIVSTQVLTRKSYSLELGLARCWAGPQLLASTTCKIPGPSHLATGMQVYGSHRFGHGLAAYEFAFSNRRKTHTVLYSTKVSDDQPLPAPTKPC
jgi:hypothetical protein